LVIVRQGDLAGRCVGLQDAICRDLRWYGFEHGGEGYCGGLVADE